MESDGPSKPPKKKLDQFHCEQIFPIFTVTFRKGVFSLIFKTSTKIRIDLPNIFDRNCPFRTLEMAF